MTKVTESVLCIWVEHVLDFFFCEQKLLAVTGAMSVSIKLLQFLSDKKKFILKSHIAKKIHEAFMFSVSAC